MAESFPLPNFVLGIPSKMNKKTIRKMKKKIVIAAITALILGVYSCTDNTYIDEMVEEQIEKSESESPAHPTSDSYNHIEQETPLPHFDKE